MTHKLFLGRYGRPVLIKSKPCYSNLEIGGTPCMLAIPVNMFFGAATYFEGKDMISTSCGVMEYDAIDATTGVCKNDWRYFRQATDTQILEALKDTKCSAFFKKTVMQVLEAEKNSETESEELALMSASL